MKKLFAVLAAMAAMAITAIPAAQAASFTERVAKEVCTKDDGSMVLSEEDMQYYKANQEYEGMYQAFGEDSGMFASYKKTKNPQSSFCKRVVYGKDKNGTWQKQGVYNAVTVLTGNKLTAPKWTKMD